MRKISIFILILCFASVVCAQDKVKTEMQGVLQSYLSLQRYIADQEAFSKKENEQKISALLRDFSSSFHNIDGISKRYLLDTLLVSNATLTDELIKEAQTSFKEGRKSYAMWRLRTVSTQCVTCHSRYEVPFDFSVTGIDVTSMSPYSRGEFYFATRQFDKAKKAFIEIALNKDEKYSRMDALRKWMLVMIRVHPDSKEALRELKRVQNVGGFSRVDEIEINDWVKSLEGWSKEKTDKASSLAKAEELIQAGLNKELPLSGSSGFVELLRGTSLLHKLLESKDSESRQRVLFLMGSAYASLPPMLAPELPEILLEQCIRSYPGTKDSEAAFKVYKGIVSREYSGISGGGIPSSVLANLSELEKLAYGIPSPEGLGRS